MRGKEEVDDEEESVDQHQVEDKDAAEEETTLAVINAKGTASDKVQQILINKLQGLEADRKNKHNGNKDTSFIDDHIRRFDRFVRDASKGLRTCQMPESQALSSAEQPHA